MLRLFAIIGLACLTAAPAWGADSDDRPVLKPGGALRMLDFGELTGERHTEIFSQGGFSLGSVYDAPAGTALPSRAGSSGTLAVGGYMAYGTPDYSLEASLRGNGAGGLASDMGASTVVPGGATTYTLRLGAEWGGDAASLWQQQLPQSGLSSDKDGTDVSLSLTLSHPITPNMVLSGSAGTARVLGAEHGAGDAEDYQLGAGLGLRF